VFARYARFFSSLFRRFETIDYRAVYLDIGSQGTVQAVEDAVTRMKADVLIYTQFPSSYSYLTPQFLSGLRACTRVVALGFDDEIYFEQSKHFYVCCDAVITSDLDDSRRLKELGISVYPAQLQQPQTLPSPSPPIEDIPVSFVGDMTKPGRREWVTTLENAGIPVRDYGHRSRNGTIDDGGVVDLFLRSKINLNFTRTNPPSWVLRHHPERRAMHQIKARPFELAALNKFCLCEWAPCVDYWFRADNEIAVFRNAGELVAAAKRYLDDERARRRVATSAHERYLKDYVPDLQFHRIFTDVLAKPRTVSQPVVPTTEALFYESIGRSRAVSFLHALRRGRPFRALGEAVGSDATKPDYWRGFTRAVSDTVIHQIRLP
jgi:hypothetical protein